MNVLHKVAVVTGAGGGVGRELTLRLLGRGAKVAGVDVNASALAETQALASAYADQFAAFALDITDQTAVKSLAGSIVERFGSVDILINNAGIIHPFCDVEEMDEAAIEKVFRVNFFGTLNMTRVFLPYLRKAGGYIVNLSSAGAISPMPGETIYGASKSAVRSLTEGLQNELRKPRIRVMTVLPGGINTNIIQNSSVSVASSIESLRERLAFLLLTPQTVAKRIVSGIERNRSRLVLGIDAVFMDGLGRICPQLAQRMIYGIINGVLAPHIRTKRAMADEKPLPE